MKVTVIGSINYDLVTTVVRVPQGGETVAAEDFATHNGGKGANEAIALGRLRSAEVSTIKLVGSIGDDFFGKEIEKKLAVDGVDTSDVKVAAGTSTGTATILVETSGENRIMVAKGANGLVDTDHLAQAEWRDSKYVLLQNEIPLETTFAVLKQAANLKVKTVFNPSPVPPVKFREYPHADVLVVNETEAELLTGVAVTNLEQADRAMETLLERCDLAIVTLGAKGVTWRQRGQPQDSARARDMGKVVDTTGAGDTFLAAFVAQAAIDKPIAECVAFATAASGIVVTRKGASSSIPTREEVLKALE